MAQVPLFIAADKGWCFVLSLISIGTWHFLTSNNHLFTWGSFTFNIHLFNWLNFKARTFHREHWTYCRLIFTLTNLPGAARTSIERVSLPLYLMTNIPILLSCIYILMATKCSSQYIWHENYIVSPNKIHWMTVALVVSVTNSHETNDNKP